MYPQVVGSNNTKSVSFDSYGAVEQGRAGAVNREMERLLPEAEILYKMSAELLERLRPVSRPDEPTPTNMGADGEPKTPPVPLALELARVISVLYQVHTNLKQAITRLEV